MKNQTRLHFGLYHAVIVGGLFTLWQVLSSRGLISPFFFGEPAHIFGVIGHWFTSGEIYIHLLVTLAETVLAFVIGAVLGMVLGLWLALSPFWSRLFEPYIKAANAMPRVIFAPIFAIWFGLGIWSKVALGVTLVLFVVFFNVYQGVREVSPTLIANARMLGASKKHMLRYVYLPSAASWVFSSLHNAIGLAFVGAVIGEYLGSSRGVGHLILQAESVFDVNTVFAGIIVLSAFALTLDAVMTRIERKVLVWSPNHATSSQA